METKILSLFNCRVNPPQNTVSRVAEPKTSFVNISKNVFRTGPHQSPLISAQPAVEPRTPPYSHPTVTVVETSVVKNRWSAEDQR